MQQNTSCSKPLLFWHPVLNSGPFLHTQQEFTKCGNSSLMLLIHCLSSYWPAVFVLLEFFLPRICLFFPTVLFKRILLRVHSISVDLLHVRLMKGSYYLTSS